MANVANLIEQRENIKERFSTSKPESDDSHNKVEDKLLLQVEEIIKCRMSDSSLNVEDLSKDLLLSRSQLFRKFKSVSPYSPNEFIKVVRLKHALDLLTDEKLNISEIAYECGFSTPSIFTTSFKKHYGKPPKEYLKSMQNKD